MKKLGFGLMRLPLLDQNDERSIDIEKVKKMADAFLGAGFTYFDTAACYHDGSSETAFREAVAERYPRDAYTITDKLTMFMLEKEEEMPAFFEGQLERLGVSFLDYYWLHGMEYNSYPKAEAFHAFEFVRKLKEEGKVKHIGFSFHGDAKLLEEILTRHPEMEYVQLQLNYLDWEDERVQAKLCCEIASRYGKPVIVMEPVKGGALASVPREAEELLHRFHPEQSSASWAVRFAASQDNVMMVLSGMSDEEQMEDNIGYMRNFVPITREEEVVLRRVKEIIQDSIAIPCTACRYCTDGCPKRISIPDYFGFYNDLKRFGPSQMRNVRRRFNQLTEKNGKPSDCVKCGKCEERCPQHLPIRKYLEDVAAELEGENI